MQTQPNLNNRPILQANINQNTNSQQCHLRICPASPKIPDLLDRRKNLKLYLRPQSPPNTSVVYTTVCNRNRDKSQHLQHTHLNIILAQRSANANIPCKTTPPKARSPAKSLCTQSQHHPGKIHAKQGKIGQKLTETLPIQAQRTQNPP
eukprot:gene13169-9015_t